MILLQFSNVLKATHFHTAYTYEAIGKAKQFLPVFIEIYTRQITCRTLFWMVLILNPCELKDTSFFFFLEIRSAMAKLSYILSSDSSTVCGNQKARRWNICKAIKRTLWDCCPWVLHSRIQWITPALVSFCFSFSQEMLENNSYFVFRNWSVNFHLWLNCGYTSIQWHHDLWRHIYLERCLGKYFIGIFLGNKHVFWNSYW